MLIIILLGSCASQKYPRIARSVNQILGEETSDKHFTGIFFYDPASKDTIFSKNSNKYFTPASNTKIFTLYTSLKLLPDHIPALKYQFSNDTLRIEGTGDPTALHPHFQDSTLIKFLNGYSNITLYPANFQEDKFGPGWAWEDYDWYYSPERSGLPLYGNVATLYQQDSVRVSPDYFRDSISTFREARNREPDRNQFYYDINAADTVEIPYRTANLTTKGLLEKMLGKEIRIDSGMAPTPKKVLSGMRLDSVLKRMMHLSDNFLAEQLLILSSSTLSDTLSSAKARNHVMDGFLVDLKQPPRWVDGSGLSRYNLFTPESMVYVLNRLYHEVPRERLLHFFPAGGISGTLKEWYPGVQGPYVFAKTGTLGNNHCLSGYLITKSGKTLIFSFMNNHFRLSNGEIKHRMQKVLETMRDSY
ncbi:D-alanyl-D-alanine carboxypeptidase/D-alanyl-D-alanine-endopeptidase [Poritiphilus flavus]|uniref:D-alanyl-D-alanine carboxypeptidase/D-alanyl-D-alanine-endopeptidase n=1 Tax=Poritiphilus flavus TaxID=2697053 RepID=UPI00293BA8E3|nr:D-alanyl-D-alanine carboxypeptidase [Poritiphilus flavus]